MDKFDILDYLNAGLVVVGLATPTFAVAQTPSVTPITRISPNDVVQDIVGGQPSPQSYYVAVPTITGVHGYDNLGVISTGSTVAFTNQMEFVIAQASSTTTKITLDTAVSPADGQHECFRNLATTTTLAVVGATGQTIDATVPTAGVAATTACWLYSAATATWYGSP